MRSLCLTPKSWRKDFAENNNTTTIPMVVVALQASRRKSTGKGGLWLLSGGM
jgi:hypothetical protein